MGDDGGHRATAIDRLAARDYAGAGDAYTRAAWRTLADPREGVGPFDADDRGWVGRGLAPLAVTWEDLHGSDPSAPGVFLTRRARYKRGRFASLLARAVEDGHLAAPRGTTEYGSDVYECPNCGATDVNWVGDATLCLRCSTPLRER
jgi:hypothetical protein